tara:strand:- start:208 stop:363 length:156 start_codon:yes stop_codon:yes gene_type:complete
MTKKETLAAIDQKIKDNVNSPKVISQLEAMVDFLEIDDTVDYIVEKLKAIQ